MINVVPLFKYWQTDTFEGAAALNQCFPDHTASVNLRLVVLLTSYTAENEIARTNAWGFGWVPVSVLMPCVTENCVVPPRNRKPDSSFGQVIGESLVSITF
jgi:hypothetical protein